VIGRRPGARPRLRQRLIPGPADAGFGTVWVLMSIGVVIAMLTGVAMVVGAMTTHARMQDAADLAALAGAAHEVTGDACFWAGVTAQANDAELVTCGQTDAVVSVDVRAMRAWPAPFTGLPRPAARAVAGP
jgi:secretion/DNA translocation related TadE-like protein